MAPLDRKLKRRIKTALDLGFGCFGDGDCTPFILLDVEGKRHLIDLESVGGTTNEQLVKSGREIINEFAKGGQYYVLVWDGYITTAGKRHDAVFAEAGAAGQSPGLLYVQRYRQNRSGRLSKIGRPELVAKTAPLWEARND